MPTAPLSATSLRPRGLAREMAFETTAELEDLEGPLGQARATEALRLAVSVGGEGYNAYVMGPPGAGKRTFVMRMLGRAALDAPTPSDWCYLNGFADPRRPRRVELPPGRGRELRADLDRLVAELRDALPSAFESRDYHARVQILEKERDEAREAPIDEIRRRAEERGIALLHGPIGFAFAPANKGEIIGPDAFQTLPEEVQERLRRDIGELQNQLAEVLRTMPDLERRHRERVKEVNDDVTVRAAGALLHELRRRYADVPAVLEHLDAVQVDLVERVHELFAALDGAAELPAALRKLLADTPVLRRYVANLLVEHAAHGGAPVVHEDLPSLSNLSGHVEHHVHMGTLVTDFTLVRAGALHRANGGYLVLDARKLLVQPFAWDALKRAIRAREIRIDPAERLLGVMGTSTLEPEPIPLHVKIVLLGDRVLYQLLSLLDPEFSQLFKVEVDFEDELPRTPELDRDFARLVATIGRRERLPPFDRGAVERVLQEATRRAGDSTRITADAGAIHDLVTEAAHAAAGEGRATVTARDVRAAIDAQERRAGRLRDRVDEEIRRGTLLVETAGARVGQVNGLSVMMTGRRAFGRPSRITARMRLGRGEVVDIEREVELGGPIHSKGVLILAGFLGGRYCSAAPLALAATLVFEQSYGGVEGDSASSAELYALLSAISGVPLRQSLAVTGSVDQIGNVQAVGGVTEKVEGFFEVCRARGLRGDEGVLVPASNVPHLVLRDEVLAAIQEGSFRVYPVATIDQGIELLSGLPAGAPDASGAFPHDSFNGRVAARLAELAAAARAFAAGGDRDGQGGRPR
ncbi:Lon protease family protein [Anaeromyxobacter sp. SG66]|uniref:Lon protease family protein n=1 Tax=Anaeromyxobacter sp. SG66 TaxID=2925410 RepID=UPI001F5620DE|nr:ATP-binding protein [Anaeromyxobacter sp. SG66]